MSHQTVVQKY